MSSSGAETVVIQSNCISGPIREKELPRAKRMIPAHPIEPPRAHKSPKSVYELFSDSFERIAHTTPANAAAVSPQLSYYRDCFALL